jgi:hypothetical protein
VHLLLQLARGRRVQVCEYPEFGFGRLRVAQPEVGQAEREVRVGVVGHEADGAA